MEPYRAYGRGGYACSGNQRGMNQRGTNTNRGNSCGCGNSTPNNTSEPTGSCGCGNSARNNSGNCCKDENAHMRHMPVGMAYVPMQQWEQLYDPETALCQGTAFPELNLKFCGSRGKM